MSLFRIDIAQFKSTSLYWGKGTSATVQGRDRRTRSSMTAGHEEAGVEASWVGEWAKTSLAEYLDVAEDEEQ